MKVLLPVDGSKHTKHMLAYLTTHEGLLGSAPEFVVLNVQTADSCARGTCRWQGNR